MRYDIDEDPTDTTGTDESDTAGVSSGDRSPMQRIADALEEHLGIDLGDIEDCDEDEFAHIVAVALRNYKGGKEKRKAKKPKRVSMSHRRNRGSTVSDDDTAAWFLLHCGYSNN